MASMFSVRSARALGPQALSQAILVHADAAAPYPLSRLPARTPPPITRAPFRLRQYANSLSDSNKLLIRCAWAGTAAFASAGYGLGWAPGTCPATFTTKASLQTAVQEFNANPTVTTATYTETLGSS